MGDPEARSRARADGPETSSEGDGGPRPGDAAWPRVLAVIPARGGSKGVPRKNVREVGGRPLVAWTVETANRAIEAGVIARCIVSTDDEEIREVAEAAGGEVPFMRPAELAGDRVPMVPVVQDALARTEATDGCYDWVLLLQPTSPFRTVQDIENAVSLAARGGFDSVISVVRVFAVHPMLMKRIEDGELLPWAVPEPEGTRRQDYDPPAFMRNGAIYLTRRDVLEAGSIRGDRTRPYEMPEERSVGIDSELEVKLVDLMLREREGIG